jgi:hypothetical protein
MGLLYRFENLLARRSASGEDEKRRVARDALARAFDEEAEKLNGGRMIEYGSARAEVSPATREAKDLGSCVRRLEPGDPRIEEATLFNKAGLLSPLDERACAVLGEPWPGGFDADAKLKATMQALHDARESRE